eukprot:988184-Pyramimonas_sp.AAC.1
MLATILNTVLLAFTHHNMTVSTEDKLATITRVRCPSDSTRPRSKQHHSDGFAARRICTAG